MGHLFKGTKYGDLVFAKEFMGVSDKETGARGGAYGILHNGAWVHFPSGNPVENPLDVIRLLEEVNPAYVSAFKKWWQRKVELESSSETPVREIRITPDSRLVYADTGDEVTDSEDVHAFFREPGVARQMAMRIFIEAESARQEEKQRSQHSLYGDQLKQVAEKFSQPVGAQEE